MITSTDRLAPKGANGEPQKARPQVFPQVRLRKPRLAGAPKNGSAAAWKLRIASGRPFPEKNRNDPHDERGENRNEPPGDPVHRPVRLGDPEASSVSVGQESVDVLRRRLGVRSGAVV